MKIKGLLAAVIVSLAATASTYGSTLSFTATSAQYGVLGSMGYDSSVFDGTSFQFVNNTNLLFLDFTDPVTSYHVTTPGPPTDSTIFDSTGALPIVVGGSGFTGGTDFTNGVYIAGTTYVIVGPTTFTDVTWSTSVLSVPEPGTCSLMAIGFIGVGATLRARRRLATA